MIFLRFDDDDDKKRWLSLILPIIILGLITWLLNIVHSKYKDEFDKNIPKPITKIIQALAKAPLAVTVLNSFKNVFTNWIGHLASDVAGSKSSPGEGMGIPGLFISVMKELSNIPPLNFTGLPKVIDKLYTQNRFDLRAELAVLNELGRQSIPVILGDVLVRTFFFVRRLITELSDKNDFSDINWINVFPLNNRTIVRMMTIETGTFSACDIADAAIRSAMKNGSPENPKFWTDLVLRVNFVGIGRFAIAISSDIRMGMDRKHAIQERMLLHNKFLMLENAKIAYMQEGVLLAAIDASHAIDHLLVTACKSVAYYNNMLNKLDDEWNILSSSIQEIRGNAPILKDEILDLLDY